MAKLTKKQADELREQAESIELELGWAIYDLGEDGECEDREKATEEVVDWLTTLRNDVDTLMDVARKFRLEV